MPRWPTSAEASLVGADPRPCPRRWSGSRAFYAFSNLPLAETYSILFITPLLITVLSIPLLGETVRLRRWAAVIVGLSGSSSCCNRAARISASATSRR